jgi:hypothetical protein
MVAGRTDVAIHSAERQRALGADPLVAGADPLGDQGGQPRTRYPSNGLAALRLRFG